MNLNLKMLSVVFATTLLIASCKCDRSSVHANPVVENETEATISKIDADGNYIYEIGNLFDLNLPNGIKLNVGESSTENKLFKQLSDADFIVSDDKTQGWVTFDRVYFSSGKADLTGVSDTQIKNIIEILKAFPSANVKIGGYSDSTGNDEVNMRVSSERAKVIADKIIADGIDATRIESEGYGAQHFVCPANDTDECKAQNRRVDIRITKK